MKKRNSILVSLASILVLGTIGLGAIGCPSTTPVVSITDVNNRLVVMEQWKAIAVSDLQSKATTDYVNSQINSKLANVSAPDLSSYATDAEVQVALDNFIANLTPAQIAALKTKLGIGGSSGGDSGVDPEDAVDCSATYTTNLTWATASKTKAITIPIQLKLSNELAVDIEDILLTAQINLYPPAGTLDINVANIYGDIDWNTAWTATYTSFESWSDVELDASDDDTFMLNYTADVTNTVSITSLIVSMRFKCIDYDIQ